MVKRMVWTIGGMMLAMSLMFGTDAGSYVATMYEQGRQVVKQWVPTHFEIERARHLIDRLGPELERSLSQVAREEVEIERLSA